MKRRALIFAFLAFSSCRALANDSTAELGTGGLTLTRSDSIAMTSEDLFVSQDEIRVHYVFRNTSAADKTVTIAFPMPDLTGIYEEAPAMPNRDSANFLDFATKIDGKPANTRVQQEVFFKGQNITAELTKYNVPFEPYAQATMAATAKLPRDVREDWIRREWLMKDEYDNGQGPQTDYVPLWTLKSTWLFDATFPAGKDVVIDHKYSPSVGGTVQVTFIGDGDFEKQNYANYQARYCMDQGFLTAVKKFRSKTEPQNIEAAETRLAYVLTTGSNWAGPIGTFHLTVDKGDADSLVSFCANGVKKTGPTTFEVTYKDYTPRQDLDVLIISPWQQDQ